MLQVPIDSGHPLFRYNECLLLIIKNVSSTDDLSFRSSFLVCGFVSKVYVLFYTLSLGLDSGGWGPCGDYDTRTGLQMTHVWFYCANQEFDQFLYINYLLYFHVGFEF
jgi:hypothetical protein